MQPSKLKITKPTSPTGDVSPLLQPLRTPDKASKEPGASSAPLAATGDGQAAKPKSGNEFVNRLVYSLIMAYTFLAIVGAGAEVCIPLVLTILIMMFREVLRINQKVRKENQLPYFRLLPWWFLWVTLLVVNAYTLRDPLLSTFPALRHVYHSFGLIAFSLYVAGLVAFVLSLRKGMYRYQFHQFTWMAMTLIFIVVQGSFQIVNMLYGMIWFLLPISCVVNNDIWAYAFGKSFGRTKLLALSPKKTLEGFLGAWLFTMIWSFWFAGFLSRFPSLVCTKVDFHSPIHCEVDPLFRSSDVSLPRFVEVVSLGTLTTISVCPAQIHAVAIAIFASLIAPFGGFFASGLKRAFKLKDFGDLIPGHGGMTDRMDCQIIMGMFTFVYVRSVIYASDSSSDCPSFAQMLECAATLTADQRGLLLDALSKAALQQ